jgi:aldehyde dehydrogenase (NAD+)
LFECRSITDVGPTQSANLRLRRNDQRLLVIVGYADEADAIAIANDTDLGLAAYVQGEKTAAARVARKLPAGQVALNYADMDFAAQFGGYKQSGNGREWGKVAFSEYLETEAIIGTQEAA